MPHTARLVDGARFKAILEICKMAQSSSHMSFACLQMPDELSALIQGMIRARVRRNWPLVLAFEIRCGLQQGEFVAVNVLPCVSDDALTNARDPFWLGKGTGFLGGSGCRSRDMLRIQWLEHTTVNGASCWMESSRDGCALKSTIVAAGFNLNPMHVPNRPPHARQFTVTCCVALTAFSVPEPVLLMLASACESSLGYRLRAGSLCAVRPSGRV